MSTTESHYSLARRLPPVRSKVTTVVLHIICILDVLSTLT